MEKSDAAANGYARASDDKSLASETFSRLRDMKNARKTGFELRAEKARHSIFHRSGLSGVYC